MRDAVPGLQPPDIKGENDRKNTVNIFELKTGKRKLHQVEDRYFTKEYAALIPDQKKELALKRTRRGHKPGEKGSKAGGGQQEQNQNTTKDAIHNIRKVVNRQVAKLAKQKSQTAVDNGMADSMNTSVASADNCNGKCSNPSLTRQQKKVQISNSKK